MTDNTSQTGHDRQTLETAHGKVWDEKSLA